MNSPAEKDLIRDFIADLSDEDLVNKLQESIELLVDSNILDIRQTIEIYNTSTGDSI